MDYDLYAGGANFPAASLRKSMTTWNDVSPASPRQLQAALEQSFRDFVGRDLEPAVFDPEDLERIAVLREKYASDAWNLSL